MKTYYLHLIRHGTTEGNLKGQYVGHTDVPLAEQGVTALEELKKQFKYPGAGILFSSPLSRCLQTADILYPELTPHVISTLAERNFGCFENKYLEDLKSDPRFKAWISSGGAGAPPEGESAKQFSERVNSGFEQAAELLVKSGGKHGVIILHGGSIMSIMAAYALPKCRNFLEWACGNGRGFTLRLTPQLWMRDRICEYAASIPKDAPELESPLGNQQKLFLQFEEQERERN